MTTKKTEALKNATELLNSNLRRFRKHPGADEWRCLLGAMFAYQQVRLALVSFGDALAGWQRHSEELYEAEVLGAAFRGARMMRIGQADPPRLTAAEAAVREACKAFDAAKPGEAW